MWGPKPLPLFDLEMLTQSLKPARECVRACVRACLYLSIAMQRSDGALDVIFASLLCVLRGL